MKTFLQRFGALVLGVLLGFDRWRFRGSKRMLCHPRGVMSFLSYHSVLLKDFNKPYAMERTSALCRAIEEPAKKNGIYRYLNNSQQSKEQTALAMAREHGQKRGLIAVLGCTCIAARRSAPRSTTATWTPWPRSKRSRRWRR